MLSQVTMNARLYLAVPLLAVPVILSGVRQDRPSVLLNPDAKDSAYIDLEGDTGAQVRITMIQGDRYGTKGK